MSVLNRLALVVGLSLALTLPVEAKEALPHWVPGWYAAPEPSGTKSEASDMTLRQVVRVSIGGDQVRLRLSNAHGDKPLRLDEVRVAKRTTGSAIDPKTDRPATFAGRTDVTIPPGAYVLSDSIPLSVVAQSDLAISLYVRDPAPLTSVHDIQRGALYVATGNASATAALPDAKPDLGIGNAFAWVAGVEVSAAPTASAIVTFGDSITDGYGITPDQGRTWPERFSARLTEAGLPLSVVNAGISGNRMLHHGQWARFGDGALARFDRDVLALPNVSAVVIFIGINDLGHAGGPETPEYVSVEALTGGLSQMATRARAHGIKVYVSTLTPFKGTVFKDYYSDEKEARRQAVNAWIRQSNAFDGVFDFDRALEDPVRPGWLLPAYDVGDHLHPNDAGADAMAKAIPLSVFD